MSPEEIALLSQRGPSPDVGAYLGSLIFPTGQPTSGMRPIPNSANRPVVYPDREAPPLRNRDLYGNKKNGQR